MAIFVQVLGNLTADPDAPRQVGEHQVVKVRVASNEKMGKGKENTTYLDVEFWGRQGETIAQYARKGSGLLVSGKLYTDEWEDKNGGGKRSKVFVKASDFQFVGGGPAKDGGGGEAPPKAAAGGKRAKSAPAPDAGGGDDGSIPF